MIDLTKEQLIQSLHAQAFHIQKLKQGIILTEEQCNFELYISCPSCGYSPSEEDPGGPEEWLDFFEVLGCREEFVMCPRCATHIRIRCNDRSQAVGYTDKDMA